MPNDREMKEEKIRIGEKGVRRDEGRHVIT
jgi:hypothetical protein